MPNRKKKASATNATAATGSAVQPKKEKSPVAKDVAKDSDDDIPIEDNDTMASIEPTTAGKHKISRNEKKARRMLMNLGLKPMENVSRVVLRKSHNILFLIDSAEVLHAPGSDTYVVFGEVKVEDITHSAAQRAAEMFPYVGKQSSADTHVPLVLKLKPNIEAANDGDEDIDETGIDDKDIELVMDQTSCSRAIAVRTLRQNDNDIVNAIMELTI